MIAASVACAVALKSGERRSLASMRSAVVVSAAQLFALAVLKATKMSPELLPPKPPCRPMPSDTRVAMRFS